MTATQPIVTGFHDPATFSIQYVLTDPATRRCAIIDPVLDFDPHAGQTATTSADRMLRHIGDQGLTLDWILDTHPHADHFSAAGYLHDVTGAPTAIGARITEVQRVWRDIYDLPDLRTDGSQWDRLFADGEMFSIGETAVTVMLTPGHTLCSVTYVAGDAAFIHDTLFMPIPAPRAPTSPAATQPRCTAASSASWPCPAPPACSPATTTAPAAARPAGKAPSTSKGRTIRT